MNARDILKIGVIGLLLAGAGFILAIGTLTLIFAPKAGTFTPTSSSDAAAWLQALGSIGAIIGAFLIGERQAKANRDAAESARLKSEQDRQVAQLTVITLLYKLGKRFDTALSHDWDFVRMEWDTGLKNSLHAGLNAFDAMPLHEIRNSSRVLAASEVRSAVQSIYDIASNKLDSPSAGPEMGFPQPFSEFRSEFDIHVAALELAWFSVTTSWMVDQP